MSSRDKKTPPSQRHTNPHHDGGQQHQCDITGSIEIRGEVETKIPPHLEKKRDTADKEQNSREKKRFAVEVLTLFFVIIYAFITGWYAWINYRQWSDSNRNFVITERAWVNITFNFPDQSAVKEGGSTMSQAMISNVGKTPAKRLDFDCASEILRSNEPSSLNYPNPHINVFTGMLSPGTPTPMDVPKSGIAGDPYAPSTFSKPEADDLLGGRRYMIVYCKGSFDDMFNRPHWFRSCTPKVYYSVISPYSYRNCIAYNDAGDGNPPD